MDGMSDASGALQSDVVQKHGSFLSLGSSRAQTDKLALLKPKSPNRSAASNMHFCRTFLAAGHALTWLTGLLMLRVYIRSEHW